MAENWAPYCTTRNTKKFHYFLSNLDKSFVERSASILPRLQDTFDISEEKIVHTETSKLQQDKEINFFIFCQAYPTPVAISAFTIWLVPLAGKMNQIARCDWLPERARWSHLARSGLPAVSRKKNFTKSHLINPLLTKFVRSRWLDIGLVLFLRVYGPRLCLGP